VVGEMASWFVGLAAGIAAPRAFQRGLSVPVYFFLTFETVGF